MSDERLPYPRRKSGNHPRSEGLEYGTVLSPSTLAIVQIDRTKTPLPRHHPTDRPKTTMK